LASLFGTQCICLSGTDKLQLFLILFEPIIGQSFSDWSVAHENFYITLFLLI